MAHLLRAPHRASNEFFIIDRLSGPSAVRLNGLVWGQHASA